MPKRNSHKSTFLKKGQRKENEEFVFIRGIPNELKHKFKAYCGLRKKSMTRVIISLMRDCVEGDPRLKTTPPPSLTPSKQI